MPNVTDPNAVQFAGLCRQYRDLEAQLYNTGIRLKQLWDAGLATGLQTKLPDDATYTIVDGAGTANPNSVINAADVRRCLDTQFALQNYEERGVLDQSVAVNNAKRDTMLRAAVNGRPAF